MKGYYRDEELLKALGASIKRIRIAKGMSQLDLSINLETSQSNIPRMEKGKVNFSILGIYHLIEALDTTPAELFADIKDETILPVINNLFDGHETPGSGLTEKDNPENTSAKDVQ